MRSSSILEWLVVAVALAVISGLTYQHFVIADIRAENERLHTQVVAADSAAAIRASETEAALAYAEEMADSATRIAADAQRTVTDAETRVTASRDSVAILRTRLDSVPTPVPELVAELANEYEAIIAAKDTIIAARERELAAERLRVRALDASLAAALVEIDAKDDALAARDAQIQNLERALRPSIFPGGKVAQAGVVVVLVLWALAL